MPNVVIPNAIMLSVTAPFFKITTEVFEKCVLLLNHFIIKKIIFVNYVIKKRGNMEPVL
jgi:hypothetical protein